MWVYLLRHAEEVETGKKYAVGFLRPSTDSFECLYEKMSREEAEAKVNFLNGGSQHSEQLSLFFDRLCFALEALAGRGL